MHNDIAITLVIVTAVAVLIQLAILYGIFKSVSRLTQEITEARLSFDRAKEPLMSDVKALLNQSIELVSHLNRISEDFYRISSTARMQIEKVDGVVTEAADRARQHVQRLDAIVGDAIEKVEHTSRVIQDNILEPVRQVSAVIKGVRTGLEFLTSKRQPAPVDKATQDEAMFI